MRECRNPDCSASLEGKHPQQIWCSERCRRSQYSEGRCRTCGKAMKSKQGWRCTTCVHREKEGQPPLKPSAFTGENTPEANRKRIAKMRVGVRA